MQRVLSFEQTPPLAVPLRFFLTAPLFAVAAGLVLLWHGPDALLSRWTPATLALTHLLTLGFLSMCMLGAVLQILPVVAGIHIPYPRFTAGAAHALLVTGTTALAGAFLLSSPLLFKLALPLLLIAFAWLFGAGLRGVWLAPHASAMLNAIRCALAALAVTVMLGAMAASGFAWPLSLPLMQITDLHAAWGLLGWVGLLVAGVAYQVVPMFQVTPLYPQSVQRWLAVAIVLLLALWTAASLAGWDARWQAVPAAAITCAYGMFGCVTLYLLSKRKRPKADATTLFWRTALASLLACAVLWALGSMVPSIAEAASFPIVLGILFLVGFGYSVVNGMLYKIVPFLVWYHLQNMLAGGATKAPNVKQILPDAAAEQQFRAHLLALVLLVMCAFLPEWLARVAALAFAFSSAMLWMNLLKAASVYRRMTAHPDAAGETAQRPS